MTGDQDGASAARMSRRRAGIIPAIILVVIAIFIGLAVQDRTSRHAAAEHEADQITFVLAQAVRATLDQHDRVLDALTAEITRDGVAGVAGKSSLKMVPSMVSSIAATAILDTAGTILARSDTTTSEATFRSIAADATGELPDDAGMSAFLTTSVYDTRLGTDLVGLARAWHEKDGRLGGLVLLVVDPSRFDVLKRLPLLRPGSQLTIQRADGTALFRFPDTDRFDSSGEAERVAGAYPGSAVGSFRSAAPKRDGTGEMQVHYRSVIGFPLVVSYARNAADIERPWRARWAINGVLIGTAIAAFLVLAGILARRQQREVAREAGRRAREALSLRRNVAELAAAAVRADEANRAKSRFFAHVTHELRTPLNAILGFSEVIRRELFGPVENARYLEYAGLIHDSGEHLLSLINDLLDMAKIEAGRMEIAPIRVAAPALLRSALDIVHVLAREQSIVVTTSGAESCPDLVVDPRAAKQVLVNLLSNAIKFTPAGGRIDIDFAEHADGGVAISIADTGIGMSDEQIRTAFEPFGQVPSDLARSDKGTGLGLPLARNLVGLHGGELTIDSRPGQGTTVIVIFPSEAEGPATRLLASPTASTAIGVRAA